MMKLLNPWVSLWGLPAHNIIEQGKICNKLLINYSRKEMASDWLENKFGELRNGSEPMDLERSWNELEAVRRKRRRRKMAIWFIPGMGLLIGLVWLVGWGGWSEGSIEQLTSDDAKIESHAKVSTTTQEAESPSGQKNGIHGTEVFVSKDLDEDLASQSYRTNEMEFVRTSLSNVSLSNVRDRRVVKTEVGAEDSRSRSGFAESTHISDFSDRFVHNMITLDSLFLLPIHSSYPIFVTTLDDKTAKKGQRSDVHSLSLWVNYGKSFRSLSAQSTSMSSAVQLRNENESAVDIAGIGLRWSWQFTSNWSASLGLSYQRWSDRIQGSILKSYEVNDQVLVAVNEYKDGTVTRVLEDRTYEVDDEYQFEFWNTQSHWNIPIRMNYSLWRRGHWQWSLTGGLDGAILSSNLGRQLQDMPREIVISDRSGDYRKSFGLEAAIGVQGGVNFGRLWSGWFELEYRHDLRNRVKSNVGYSEYYSAALFRLGVRRAL